MEQIDYSVIIRTTGLAGEKYQSLLDSIKGLDPPPVEVIVVLPIGFSEPSEKIGCEKFYFTEKGMVRQRLYGINQCKSKYALICDDDVCFSSDFVKKLYKPIRDEKAKITAGPLLSFLPQKGINSIIDAITGAAVPSIFHRDKYISILSTSGYSYNRNIDISANNIMYSDSLPWTCFFTETAVMKQINLEEEKWLDSHGYAALDDQTMFYKAKLLGIKTAIVTDATYEHLDAKTSTSSVKSRPNVIYSSKFNRYIFWYRFIMEPSVGIRRLWVFVCFAYYNLWDKIYDLVDLKRGRCDNNIIALKKQALADAKKYVQSSEYLDLMKI